MLKTIDEGRTITNEIVELLKGLSPQEKLRVKDMVVLSSIISKAPDNGPETQKTA